MKTHSELNRLTWAWELDELERQGEEGIAKRCDRLFRLLRQDPDLSCESGRIADLLVEEVSQRLSKRSYRDEYGQQFEAALARDGFSLDPERGLLRTLPEIESGTDVEDEVHELLARHELGTSLGHLDQALDAHARGKWASANSQIRTFYESLFDEIAEQLAPRKASGTHSGEARRQLLANLPEPFIERELNEWSDDGKNLVNGVFKRLHPAGAHPGLSDEEDSTFRLQLVLLMARLFLRRLDRL